MSHQYLIIDYSPLMSELLNFNESVETNTTKGLREHSQLAGR